MQNNDQSTVSKKTKVQLYDNTAQEHITITKDRVELILLKHLEKIKSKKGWMAPLSFLITLILIPITADFKAALWLSASTWSGFCRIAIFLSFVWLIYTTYLAIKARKININTIIEELKNKNNE